MQLIKPTYLYVIFSTIFMLFCGYLFLSGQLAYNSRPANVLPPLIQAPKTPSKVVCKYHNKTYQVGDTFPCVDDCNTCRCRGTGEITQTLKMCKEK